MINLSYFFQRIMKFDIDFKKAKKTHMEESVDESTKLRTLLYL